MRSKTTKRPVTGKRVAGRKPKPLTLNRVKFSTSDPNDDDINWEGHGERRTRLTVRVAHLRDSVGECWAYSIWDKQQEDWLYPPSNSARYYLTREAAWRYLKTTTEDDPEYRMERINRKLDRGAA